jgi:hypothetical protein
MFVIDTDLQGEPLREANLKEPLEEPSGFALALRDWPQATHSGRSREATNRPLSDRHETFATSASVIRSSALIAAIGHTAGEAPLAC